MKTFSDSSWPAGSNHIFVCSVHLALSRANAVRNPKKLLARSFSLLETADFQYAFSQPTVVAKLQKSDYEESKHVLKIFFVIFFGQMEVENICRLYSVWPGGRRGLWYIYGHKGSGNSNTFEVSLN